MKRANTTAKTLPLLVAAYLIVSFFLPAASGAQQDEVLGYKFVASSGELESREDGEMAFAGAVIHQDALAPLLDEAAASEKIEFVAVFMAVVDIPGGESNTRSFGPITEQFGQKVTVTITVPGAKKPKVLTRMSGTIGEDPNDESMGFLSLRKQFALKKLKKKLGAEGGPVVFEAEVSGADVDEGTVTTASYSIRRPNPRN